MPVGTSPAMTVDGNSVSRDRLSRRAGLGRSPPGTELRSGRSGDKKNDEKGFVPAGSHGPGHVVACNPCTSPGTGRSRSARRFRLLPSQLEPGTQFCALSSANQAQDECRRLTEANFEQTPLTVHGLWPNRTHVSANLQPHDCPGPPFDVPPPVQSDLRRYMPGGSALQRHEWRKHGTCSGLPPETYFANIVSLARQANDAIGAVLRERGMLGHTVRITDLLSAVAARDQATASAIVVDCRQPRGGGDVLIGEIRLVLSKDLKPMPASSVGFGQNSGCPRGAGRVPRVPG
jgi:ribonuclease T2